MTLEMHASGKAIPYFVADLVDAVRHANGKVRCVGISHKVILLLEFYDGIAVI